MKPGNLVYDKEYHDFSTTEGGAEEPDPLVVISKLDETIEEHVVFEDSGETVADHNPDYPSQEPVILAAFVEDMDDKWPEWRDVDPDKLYEKAEKKPIRLYSFPEKRLERATEVGKQERLKRIATKLYDNGYAAYLKEDKVTVNRDFEIDHIGNIQGEGENKQEIKKLVKEAIAPLG